MFQKLKNLLLKKKNKGKNKVCGNCVWHNSEEENNVPFKKGMGYCDIHKQYTSEYNRCPQFKVELFEATENSTTLERSMDIETSLEQVQEETKRLEEE